ncbi:energy transducer TonB [Geomonas oryzisoli]|uniref:Energy transducer TonB n=1 Tax=Geomonas oryzisoli TaxID=2847992 RepID=A0ABX8JFE7_9BACT|nr:TonB family protein [Geomonas oryzisoli]QWV94245.1 energy transducer TonB [Geomonas oryzisoli]
MAPLLLVSLLLHAAALYGLSRLTTRQGRAEQAAEAVVAYLELGGPTRTAGPSSVPRATAAPVAAISTPAAPAAVPRLPASAAPSAESAKASAGAAPAAVTPPATGASSGEVGIREAGNHQSVGRPAGGGAEVMGREAARTRAAALSQGVMAGTAAAAASPRGNPGTSGGMREVRGSYQAQLKRLIEAHKEYPLAARRSGREGSCRRRFALRRDGSLQRVEAVSSCGHPFLDAAASRAVSSVGTFPAPPAELSLDEPFEVTITFALAAK